MRPWLICFSDGVNLLEFVKFIENNTRVHIDMEFLLDCLTQYLCHEWDQERVICQLEHMKRNSMSTCKQPCIILFLEHTNDIVFWQFSEDFWPLSEKFLKILKKISEGLKQMIPVISQKIPKLTKDFQR